MSTHNRLALSIVIVLILVLFGESLVAFFVTADTGLFDVKSGAGSNIVLESIRSNSITANNNNNNLRGSPPPLTSLCRSLALYSKQSKIPKFEGNPAALVYACNKNGSPAFYTSSSRIVSRHAVTPLFTLPSGWGLSVGVARPSGDCSSRDGLVKLTSGTPIILRAKTSYIYCLTTNSASNFTSFTISWTR